MQMILTQLTNMNQSMSDIRSLLMAQNDKIVTCIDRIDTLSRENELLKNKVRNLEEIYTSKSTENLFNEMRMCREQEQNVIIFGIEETLEIVSVQQLVKDVTAPNTVKIINTTHLGKPAKDLKRPVKVEF
ncbi:hypothetical protein JTB14_006668 [Gonioctena quinquepunctata]|nr:hypothetical protein JTB14_006668 [Gonioctena quinquepunctata]